MFASEHKVSELKATFLQAIVSVCAKVSRENAKDWINAQISWENEKVLQVTTTVLRTNTEIC